jgi:hypothetical protein
MRKEENPRVTIWSWTPELHESLAHSMLPQDLSPFLPMNTKNLLLSAFVLTSGIANAVTVEIARVDQVSSVSTKQGTGGKPAAGAATSGPVAVSQNRTLKIVVRNMTSVPQNSTVRYWTIGRDMGTNKTLIMDGGEKNVSLKPNGEETLECDPVKGEFKQKPVFLVTSAAGGARGAQGAAKPAAPVKPSGNKIVGYGIQIIREGKVVDEKFSEPSYKKLVGGTENGTPAPLFTKPTEEKEAGQ